MRSDPLKIVFDLTHLVARQGIQTPTGIDRVDAIYARHLASLPPPILHAGVQYGLRQPFAFAPAHVRHLAARQMENWRGDGAFDQVLLDKIGEFLRSGPEERTQATRLAAPDRPAFRHTPVRSGLRNLSQRIRDIRIPEGAIYLNAAQYLLEMPLFTAWMKKRRDVKPVFFIHDVIPVDYPEYFKAERSWRFPRILHTALSHASALICSCETTKERLERYIRDHGRPAIPIHADPLPADDVFHRGQSVPEPAEPNGFVLSVGTVEPRKNYSGLLHLWRRMAREGIAAPKLIMAGRLGWENEDIVSMLDRSQALKGNVLLVSGLSDEACFNLLMRSRGAIAASFAEGYGIPVVEALTTGKPVIASDIPVFRDISQGCATFCAPLDGPAWQRAVMQMVDPQGLARMRDMTQAFKPPTWEAYFDRLLDFLRRVQRQGS